MKSFLLLISAALLATTCSAGGLCANNCKAVCDIRKQTCDLAGLYGTLCGTANNFCTKVCDINCVCVDTCGEKALKDFAACKDSDASLGGLKCVYPLFQETLICGTECVATTVSSIIGQLVPGTAP